MRRASSAGDTVTQGDCTRQTFDALEARHVEELPGDYEYNSLPATSGLHSPTTAIWNLYDQPVPEINYVHNLEHGGIVIQYGSEVPAEDIASLANWYGQDTRGLVVAPLSEEFQEEDPTLADQIVATSWTHMLRCGSFNEEALRTSPTTTGARRATLPRNSSSISYSKARTSPVPAGVAER